MLDFFCYYIYINFYNIYKQLYRLLANLVIYITEMNYLFPFPILLRLYCHFHLLYNLHHEAVHLRSYLHRLDRCCLGWKEYLSHFFCYFCTRHYIVSHLQSDIRLCRVFDLGKNHLSTLLLAQIVSLLREIFHFWMVLCKYNCHFPNVEFHLLFLHYCRHPKKNVPLLLQIHCHEMYYFWKHLYTRNCKPYIIHFHRLPHYL